MLRELRAAAGQRGDVRVLAVDLKTLTPDDALHARTLGVDYLCTLEVGTASGQLNLGLTMTPQVPELPAHRALHEAPSDERRRFTSEAVTRMLDDVVSLLDERVLLGMRDWGTSNLQAYRYAMVAHGLHRHLDQRSLAQAALQLRLAIETDPVLSKAYVELLLVIYRMMEIAVDNQSLEQLRQSGRALLEEARARRIEPSAVHTMEQCWVAMAATGPSDLESRLHADLVKDTRNRYALAEYAQLLMGAGYCEEGERYNDRAIELDDGTNSFHFNYATLAGCRGDLALHARLLLEMADDHPDFVSSLGGAARSLAGLGRFHEAEGIVERIRAVDPSHSYHAKLMVRAMRGDLEPASAAYEKLMANEGVTRYSRGFVAFIVGDVERGVRLWRHVEPVFAVTFWRYLSQWEFLWAPGIADDARYQGVLEEIGVGHRWKRHLWERAQALGALTGIPMMSPQPATSASVGLVAGPALDVLPFGLLGLDRAGRILFQNAAATRILSRRRGLHTIGGQLVAEDPAAFQALRAALARVDVASSARIPSTLVRCPRPLPARALQVLVTSVQALETVLHGDARRFAQHVVIVSDPDEALVPDAHALQLLFELTPAQSRLAMAIVAGRTIAEYAKEQGLSENSARQRLKELMARVDVTRQADLVRLMLSGVAQLRPERSG